MHVHSLCEYLSAFPSFGTAHYYAIVGGDRLCTKAHGTGKLQNRVHLMICLIWLQVSPTSTQHAAKAMAASKELVNLAALPMEKHSPFFICGLVFACIVQLSACSAYPGKSSTQQNRDRVALTLGALKSFSETWIIAQYVSQQLKRAASEIFKPRPEAAAAPSSSSYDSGIDISGFAADISWLDLFYPNDGSGAGINNHLLSGVHDINGI